MSESAPPITQKLLVSAGGWPAMKQAQQLHAAGRVSEASYEPPILSGFVREGNRQLRSGLRITSERDVENLCTCRESREWGKICPHALAVGLAFLEPPKATAPTPTQSALEHRLAPVFVESGSENATPLTLHFILPPNFESSWAKAQIMIVSEVELEGKRVQPSALRPNERYACDTFDLTALEPIVPLAAMRICSRNEFLRVLRSLRGHPRVTFGKTTAAEISTEVFRPRLRVHRQPDGSVRIELANREQLLWRDARRGVVDGMDGTAPVPPGPSAWLRRGHSFQPLPDNLPNELFALADGPLTLRGAQLVLIAPQLGAWFQLEGDALPKVETAHPVFELKIEGSLREVRAEL
ncbi:MAG: hypothetical protein M3Y86_05755, partial [Verrucomicrobiota bacterium]|nr:hypothetical protein [Verrucomicrobiota bacterium]